MARVAGRRCAVARLRAVRLVAARRSCVPRICSWPGSTRLPGAPRKSASCSQPRRFSPARTGCTTAFTKSALRRCGSRWGDSHVRMVAIMGAYTAALGYALSALDRTGSRRIRVRVAARVSAGMGHARVVSRLVPQRLSLARARLFASRYAARAVSRPSAACTAMSLAVAMCAGAVALIVLGGGRSPHRLPAVASLAAIWIAGFLSVGSTNGRSRYGKPVTCRDRAGRGAAGNEMGRGATPGDARSVPRPHAAASGRTDHRLAGIRVAARPITARRLSAARVAAAREHGSIAGSRSAAPRFEDATTTTTRCWRSMRKRSGTTSDVSFLRANSSRCRPSCANGCAAWNCHTAASRPAHVHQPALDAAGAETGADDLLRGRVRGRAA